MLRWNIIANYFGQAWAAFIGLVFIPLYIKYLGFEAYGLIGLFMTLQIWLVLLDFGLTPTLGREVARYTGGEKSAEAVRDLIKTIEFILIPVGIVIIFLFFLSADWLSRSWFNFKYLQQNDISNALKVMGFVIATRFVEGIYRSVILGLQKHVVFNVIYCSVATIRAIGAVAILHYINPTIQLFFAWQAFVSCLSLIILIVTTYLSLPKTSRPGRFCMQTLKEVWGFAGGMLLITFTGLMLSQFDKVFLSKALPLEIYGAYILSATVASSVFLLVQPITQSFYPKFCELVASKNENLLVITFHKAAKLVTVVAGSVCIILALNAETFLMLWTGDKDITSKTATVLIILTIANGINGFMWVTFQLQLAYAWTRISLIGNILGLSILFPLFFYSLPRYGTVGVASSWLVINLFLFFIMSHLTFRKILKTEKWEWYLKDILIPFTFGLGVAVTAKFIWKYLGEPVSGLYLLFAFGVTLAASSSLAGNFKNNKNSAEKRVESI